MICRNCGTEIADKAIVCYRCGTATSDSVRKPALVRQRRSPLFSFVALALLGLLGLYLGTAGQAVLPPDRGYGLAAGVAIAIAIVILIVRIVRRR
jgi:zinc-ribbon domain